MGVAKIVDLISTFWHAVACPSENLATKWLMDASPVPLGIQKLLG